MTVSLLQMLWNSLKNANFVNECLTLINFGTQNKSGKIKVEISKIPCLIKNYLNLLWFFTFHDFSSLRGNPDKRDYMYAVYFEVSQIDTSSVPTVVQGFGELPGGRVRLDAFLFTLVYVHTQRTY